MGEAGVYNISIRVSWEQQCHCLTCAIASIAHLLEALPVTEPGALNKSQGHVQSISR